MKSIFLSALLSLIFFSGCAMGLGSGNLDRDEKKQLYLSVQNEIEHLVQKGDILYAKKHYADAAEAYEKANFYKGSPVVSTSKIEDLKKRAKANGAYYYARGVKYLKKDKIKALYEFNRMMYNDKDYKNGKELFEELKNDTYIKGFLKTLRDPLEKALNENKTHEVSIKKIDALLQKLTQYDEYDEIALKAQEYIDSKHDDLVNSAVNLFKQGKITEAKNSFDFIESIYVKDKTAEKYLKEIATINTSAKMLSDAQKAFDAGEYDAAMQSVEKVLKISPNDKNALLLAEKIKKENEKKIPELIELGKNYYNKQDFEKALNAFQRVLTYSPEDNTSLTFVKKIKNQIKTIQNLK